MATIQDIRPLPPKPVITFDWTPKSVSFTHTHAGNTYPWGVNLPSSGAPDQPDQNYTSTNTELTFTATITGLESNLTILEYIWRFGDGTIGYGPVTTHTYKAVSASTRVALQVTDSLRRKFYTGRMMNLSPADPVSMGQGIIAP